MLARPLYHPFAWLLGLLLWGCETRSGSSPLEGPEQADFSCGWQVVSTCSPVLQPYFRCHAGRCTESDPGDLPATGQGAIDGTAACSSTSIHLTEALGTCDDVEAAILKGEADEDAARDAGP